MCCFSFSVVWEGVKALYLYFIITSIGYSTAPYVLLNISIAANLRFGSSASLGKLASLFGDTKHLLPAEIVEAFQHNDDRLELHYFSNDDELNQVLKRVLQQVSGINNHDSLAEIFADIYESGDRGVLNLEKVQIITPRMVGSFGSTAINTNVIRDGKSEFLPRTKLICEKNRYVYINRQGQNKRVLALANGSLGYIQANVEPHFHDLDDFEKEFWRIPQEIRNIKKEVSADFNGLERDIDFGDAITVHKAQGSDYDVVIFVIPEIGPFIVRELLYTAFTRAKNKLHIVIHENLKEELASEITNAHRNSAIVQRKTLLYGYKTYPPSKPYELRLKDGRIIGVRSKVECIIAKAWPSLQGRVQSARQCLSISRRLQLADVV